MTSFLYSPEMHPQGIMVVVFIHHLGPDICFDEYNYHDSLRAFLSEGIDHFGDTAVILYSIVSNTYYGIAWEQIQTSKYLV